jgi:hypothetical protein
MKIWETDGSNKELQNIKLAYPKNIEKIKPKNKIYTNKEKESVINCMLFILTNMYDDHVNQFVYDFFELYIGNLERLNVKEKYIQNLFALRGLIPRPLG